ncbi:MAG: B12-binding domain-containing radical SAM protein [Phycisphaerae bacterium]
MRILLVKPKAKLATIRKLNPLITLEPLELGYLAASAGEGHDVRVLDLRLAHWPAHTFSRTLLSFKPDLVGLTGYTHEVTRVIELARIIRRQSPRSIVVVGGHHATVLPGDYNLDCFDAIVRGEGCAPFRAIVDAVAEGHELDAIENVLVPGKRYDDQAAGGMPVYPDLAGLPVPRRDLWDARHYRCVWPTERHPRGQTIFPPVALVRTSFGCRMNCSFCVVPSLSGRRHICRPVDEVADEIAGIDLDHIYFCDDETFLDPGHVRSLVEAVRVRNIRKRYFAWARSTSVTRWPELFAMWRSEGLDAVFLGMEASTDAELEDISKHATIADNEKAHAALRGMGIAVQAGFMVNSSFTRQDFKRLRRYVANMPPAQVTFTVYTPSPGSEAWYGEREKYVCHPYELHDCMHPLTATSLPLREFYREFSMLSSAGSARNPLRSPRTRMPVRDIFKIVIAAGAYSSTLRRAYRDYPRSLW